MIKFSILFFLFIPFDMNLAKITVTSSRAVWKKATVHKDRVLSDHYALYNAEQGGMRETSPIQTNVPLSVS